MSHATFNTVNSADLYLEYFVLDVPLLPEKRKTAIEIAGRDGSVDFGNESYAPRIITAHALLKATSEANLTAYLKDIAVWLSGEGYLISDDNTDQRWYGKVFQMVEQERYPLFLKFKVFFECQPYATDATETEAAVIETPTDYASDVEFYPTINATLYNLENQCTNGDFPTVTTGWTDVGADLAIASGACTVTGDGSSATVELIQANAAVLDVAHKYYVRATVSVSNADCLNIKLDYDGSTAGTAETNDTQATPENGTSYTLSALDTPPADAEGAFQINIHHDYADAATANTKVMTVDNVFVIDVTSVFGAGSEPSLATMDGYMTTYLAAQSVTHFTDTLATSFQVSLASTGELVLLTDTYANEDVLEINMSTGKVTKNAANCMDKVSLTSTFFGVPTGEQTITVTSDGFYLADMDYYKRYLYA